MSGNLLLQVATMTMMINIFMVVKVGAQYQLSRHGCRDKCGNVTIPYPFGIGEGCYYSDNGDGIYYNITCDEKHGPPRPMYGDESNGMEVLDIGLSEGQIRIAYYNSRVCYAKNGSEIYQNSPSVDMQRFTISSTMNMFAAIGCDTYVWFEGMRHDRDYSTGCMTVCDSLEDVVNGTCSGVGCCQVPVPDGITSINISATSFENHAKVRSFNPCSSAFVVAKDAFNFSVANLTRMLDKVDKLPVVFDWTVGIENCSSAYANGTCLCKGKSTCVDSIHNIGYQCQCLPGYTGNPYLENGCQDINECADPRLNDCEYRKYCKNIAGGFECHCPKGFQGNGTKAHGCVKAANKNIFTTAFMVAVGVGGGIIVKILVLFWLYWQHEKKQLLKERKDYFRQNGGHLLHTKLAGRDVSVESVKIFTAEELEKATNKYGDNNIIGKGGFGVVYSGILSNNQVVAIKKSLKVDSAQSEQFINEMIVLSQLNNRHVVKLLGCCLETEVPLLVYEFIDNGTLNDHLHDEEKASLLTWDVRLRIASEVAEVLSYLHTTISIPIIHRDIKSTNILLDRNYTAKVSDFGASRLVPMDQDHLATMVLGTCGYLDPEYLQTSELTPKSDVYSFGVVLVELLTREYAISYDRPESERCLAMFFLRKLKEDILHEILDTKLLEIEEENISQIKEVACLAQKCLRLKGDDRPSMKEVAIELHRIRGILTNSHPWCSTSALEKSNLITDHDSLRLLNDAQIRSNTMESCNSQISSLLASLEYGR